MKNQLFHYLLILTISFALGSCCDNNTLHIPYFIRGNIPHSRLPKTTFLDKARESDKIDSMYQALGLVKVQAMVPSIQVDLKYASIDNFIKMKLYHRLNNAYLQEEVVIKLKKAQEKLKVILPTYSLLIYDAVRPVEVQKIMWEALDSIPVYRRSKFVSNPSNKSLHNFGAAVDLTIIDSSGLPLDMGAGYDDPRKIAYPSMEKIYLKNGRLTQIQYQNRLLLRKVMHHGGFAPLETEWWHFNACSRSYAKANYSCLEKEF